MNITEKNIKVADKILEILASEECSVMEAQDILYWIIKDIKHSSTVQIKETCKKRFSDVLRN